MTRTANLRDFGFAVDGVVAVDADGGAGRPRRVYVEARDEGLVFASEDTRSWSGADFKRFMAWKEHPDREHAMTARMGTALVEALTMIFGGAIPPAVLTCPPSGQDREGLYPAGVLAAEVRRLTGIDLVDVLRRTSPRRGRGRGATLKYPPTFERTAAVGGLVLLVDDVMTTGSTIRAARRALACPCIALAYAAWHTGRGTDES